MNDVLEDMEGSGSVLFENNSVSEYLPGGDRDNCKKPGQENGLLIREPR
jgi:hypothetical protein